MNFVPKIPGAVPVSYGQGFGDWQQYAGFDKKNPFGALPDQAVPPPVAAEPYKPDTAMPEIDYAIKPPTGMGYTPTMNQGFALPSLQEPTLEDSIDKYYGVK